jgi:hypothetical protein
MSFVTAVPETLAVCAIHGKCGSRVGDPNALAATAAESMGLGGRHE